MSHQFEDSPPMSAPSRPMVDVVQTANELCMAARQARARLAIKTIGSCKCGRPVYRDGLCTGCSEDAFYAKVRTLPAGEQFE